MGPFRVVGPRTSRLCNVALVLLASLAGGVSAQADGDSEEVVSTLEALLPYRADNIAAVAVGDQAYLFGGAAFDEGPGGSDHILRFNPASGEITTLAARLPVPVYKPLAVTVGGLVYVMGGVSNHEGFPQAPRDIVRFDPETETVTVMGARLPWGVRWGAAAWDGRYIDVFGGCVNSEPCNVVRYDPDADKVTLGGPRLDGDARWRIQEGVAFALGPLVYLFGAQDRSDPLQGHRLVLLYDSTSDSLVELPGHLPVGRQGASATWDGRRFLLFGGVNNTGQGGYFETTILAFDPLTLHWDLSCAQLPARSEGTAAAWVDGAAYVFAGDTSDHRHIFRVRSHLLTGPDCTTPLSRPTVPINEDIVAGKLELLPVTPAVQLGVGCEQDEGAWEADVQVARIAADLALQDASIGLANRPSLAEAGTPENAAGAGLYVQVDSQVVGCKARIRIELQAGNETGVDASGTDLAVHYYNGTTWVDLSLVEPGATVRGATPEQDLRVYATGFDAGKGLAWAEVDHASVYSLGRAGDAAVPEAPWPGRGNDAAGEDPGTEVPSQDLGGADSQGPGATPDAPRIAAPGAWVAAALLAAAFLARRGGG